MRRNLLRVDAVFLGLAGVFGLVSDLLSYLSGAGPFGTTFYENSTVIGVVEAHSLAVLTAGTLWYFAQNREGTFGNWIGLLAHLVLGVCNIIWFDVFTRVQADAQGLIVTVLHFVFVTLNAVLIIKGGKGRAGSVASTLPVARDHPVL